MRIAYLILAHKRSDLLIALIEALMDSEDGFFIHLDARTPTADVDRVVALEQQFPNVHLVPSRYACLWGDFSLVQATLVCVRNALEHGTFGYGVLLSGQDYPIKSQRIIKSFLIDHYPANFIDYFSLPSADHWPETNGGIDRITYPYPHSVQPILSRGYTLYTAARRRLHLSRYLPLSTWYGGSQWWCLTCDSLTWILRAYDSNPMWRRFFRYSQFPDELFFQTVLSQSPFAAYIVSDNLRTIWWHKSLRPWVFRYDDVATLVASPGLFARKFDDTAVLKAVDQQISRLPNYSPR